MDRFGKYLPGPRSFYFAMFEKITIFVKSRGLFFFALPGGGEKIGVRKR
jgi:hypothetical protein